MLRERILSLLPAPVRSTLQAHRRATRLRRLLRESAIAAASARAHDAPAPLYVSLTSIPSRFGILHLTLRSLLDQSVRADGVLLWIAEESIDLLPAAVTALQRHGLMIRPCPDIRSYKKLIYALGQFPDAFLVTADDDNYYEPAWLETLIAGIEPGRRTIVCYRAHRVATLPDGRLAPYAQWDWDVQDDAARQPSLDLLAIGVGGTLYPPGCLSPEVFDRTLFQTLCPTADDLWFHWMACRAGTMHKKVGGVFPLIQMPGSQQSKLFGENEKAGNDRQVRMLEEAFGPPRSPAEPAAS